MTRSEFISRCYLRATGKPTPPTAGTKKYNQIVGFGEIYTEQWTAENNIEWQSLYDFFSLAALVTATDTFALSATIRKVSTQEGDTIKIVHTDDRETEYTLIPADRLQEYKYENAVAIVGRNLVFSSAFTADSPQLGGTIVVPAYGYATFPATDAEDITVDDPNWLVTICAAEFVRNDSTRQNQYPNLIAEANELMKKMKANSGNDVDEAYRPAIFYQSDYMSGTEW